MNRAVRSILAVLVTAVLLAGCNTAVSVKPAATDDVIAEAYDEQQSGVQVAGSGTVIRVLSDDSNGSRHQRFIIELGSGQTLLIAHNIDVAPRIATLREGDEVEFNGVYEWNDEGGTIHWTHHDPDGSHEPGWIKHNGTVYQ